LGIFVIGAGGIIVTCCKISPHLTHLKALSSFKAPHFLQNIYTPYKAVKEAKTIPKCLSAKKRGC
jgi:hypothetical protein